MWLVSLQLKNHRYGVHLAAVDRVLGPALEVGQDVHIDC